MKQEVIQKLHKKVSRQMELEMGRVSYNRVHKNKKSYDRKRDKKVYID